MKYSFAAILATSLLTGTGGLAQSDAQRPNILLVVLDDVGFMGIGPYGSDAKTPIIDRLAEQGTMFTRFYASPLCAPSRASLLTGMDPHQVGIGTLVEAVSPEAAETPAYSMKFAEDQATIGSLLQDAGYQTFVTGKWGIGRIGTNLPNEYGFDRSFILDATGASNYEARPYLPGEPKAFWFEDGEEISLPEDFYSSRSFVDKMIEYVDDADEDRPFFGFLSFQAVHIPIQVPTEYVDRYNGVYDAGWDAKRQERLQTAKEIGLVPETTTLAPAPASHRSWDALDAEDKAYWARIMQANAGMTENADEHTGRLLEHLDAKGMLDNTIVAVISDNGSEFSHFGRGSGPQKHMEDLFMFIEGWNTSYEEIGGRNHMGAIGREWASVTSAPLQFYKVQAGDGGIRVPFVIAGPGIEPSDMINGLGHIADVVPTLLEAADVAYDADDFFGRSQMPVLAGAQDSVYGPDEGFGIETSGNAAYVMDDWKIAKVPPPFGDGSWRLYDMTTDPGETTDLAASHPVQFQTMLNAYQAYSQKVGIYELAPDENALKQLARNATRKALPMYWYVFLGLALIPCLALFVLYRVVKLVFGRNRQNTAT